MKYINKTESLIYSQRKDKSKEIFSNHIRSFTILLYNFFLYVISYIILI